MVWRTIEVPKNLQNETSIGNRVIEEDLRKREKEEVGFETRIGDKENYDLIRNNFRAS